VDAYFENPRDQALGEWAWATINGKEYKHAIRYFEAEKHLKRLCDDIDANVADRVNLAAHPMEKQVEIICKRVLFLELSAQ
jgi:hypothetical protein